MQLHIILYAYDTRCLWNRKRYDKIKYFNIKLNIKSHGQMYFSYMKTYLWPIGT